MNPIVHYIAPIPPERRGPPAPTWPERQGFFESVQRMCQPLTLDEQERVLNKIIKFYREELGRVHPDWSADAKARQTLDFTARMLDHLGLEIVPTGGIQ